MHTRSSVSMDVLTSLPLPYAHTHTHTHTHAHIVWHVQAPSRSPPTTDLFGPNHQRATLAPSRPCGGHRESPSHQVAPSHRHGQRGCERTLLSWGCTGVRASPSPCSNVHRLARARWRCVHSPTHVYSALLVCLVWFAGERASRVTDEGELEMQRSPRTS
jgi:hypothetical protein